MSNTDLNIGEGYNITDVFKFTNNYNYTGSVMTTTNGAIQTYSNVTIVVNEAKTIAYIEGTIYNNHSTNGESTVSFSSALRPTRNISRNNIVSYYLSQVIGENMSISTNGTITMILYGAANNNSRHTIVPAWISLV